MARCRWGWGLFHEIAGAPLSFLLDQAIRSRSSGGKLRRREGAVRVGGNGVGGVVALRATPRRRSEYALPGYDDREIHARAGGEGWRGWSVLPTQIERAGIITWC